MQKTRKNDWDIKQKLKYTLVFAEDIIDHIIHLNEIVQTTSGSGWRLKTSLHF